MTSSEFILLFYHQIWPDVSVHIVLVIVKTRLCFITIFFHTNAGVPDEDDDKALIQIHTRQPDKLNLQDTEDKRRLGLCSGMCFLNAELQLTLTYTNIYFIFKVKLICAKPSYVTRKPCVFTACVKCFGRWTSYRRFCHTLTRARWRNTQILIKKMIFVKSQRLRRSSVSV